MNAGLPPQRHWTVDREYALPLALMVALSYCWAVMPAGLQWRLTLQELGGREVGTGPWFKLQWLPLFAFACWVLFRRWALLTRLAPLLNPFMYLLCLWMLATSLWAPDGPRVLRQAIIILGLVLIASAWVSASWQQDRLETVLRRVLLALAAASAVVAVALPEVGVHQSDQFELKNSWRGIAMTKYFLGHIAQFGTLLWVHAGLTGRVRPAAAAAAALFCLFVLLCTRSNTALLVLLIGLALMYLHLRPPLRLAGAGAAARLAVGLLIASPLFVYLVLIGSVTYADVAAPISNLFGKDISLSGRTFIWGEVWASITGSTRNFFFGVGYMSFWNGPGSLADEAYRRLRWVAPDGHNGYLDIWNELGLVGLLLLLGFLVHHGLMLGRVRRFAPQTHALHLSIFVMVLIENITASGWFRPVAPAFLLVLYSSVTLSRTLFEQRLRAARQLAAGNSPSL